MYRFPKKQQLMNDNEDEDCIDDDDEDVEQRGHPLLIPEMGEKLQERRMRRRKVINVYS